MAETDNEPDNEPIRKMITALMKPIEVILWSNMIPGGVLSDAPVYVLRFDTDRRPDTLSRRHVDGSFTSDVNKVLDSMAAKEYLLWVMTSKPSGDR